MTTLYLLLLAIGVAPFAAGATLLRPSSQTAWPRIDIGAVLLCALAFNLTFFWQELWLVIPKALTPGLHPILYHNDHGWTGQARDVELLQGSGALATLGSGLVLGGALAMLRGASATLRMFLFWMAFEGAYQSLTQLAIGTMVPGNDVARALAFLHVGADGQWKLLALAVMAMALAGALLARLCPSSVATREFAWEMLLTTMLAIVVIIPFRVPRALVEVAFIPLFVNLVGVGWLALGAAIVRHSVAGERTGRIGIAGPAFALGATLLVFQLVLRPGISF
jgi:hypothetical protein